MVYHVLNRGDGRVACPCFTTQAILRHSRGSKRGRRWLFSSSILATSPFRPLASRPPNIYPKRRLFAELALGELTQGLVSAAHHHDRLRDVGARIRFSGLR